MTARINFFKVDGEWCYASFEADGHWGGGDVVGEPDEASEDEVREALQAGFPDAEIIRVEDLFMNPTHTLSIEQRQLFATEVARWAIDAAANLNAGLELQSRAYWAGTETPDQADERERWRALADGAAGRAQQIAIYAILGPHPLRLIRTDAQMAEIMDELRTDEATLRPRQQSIAIIREWVEKAKESQ